MTKLISVISILLFSIMSLAQTRVVIVDSGYDLKQDIPLCKYYHADFTQTGFGDAIGHGKHVTRFIMENAKPVQNYCLVIIKIFNPDAGENSSEKASERLIQALNYLNRIKSSIHIVNLSLGGEDLNRRESIVIKSLLDAGVIIIAAAGNENKDLTKKCNYFPACADPRIKVVGCLRGNNKRCRQTNYGSPVKFWETVKGPLSGTSFAAAILTGKYIKKIQTERKLNSETINALAKASEAAYKYIGLETYINRRKDMYIGDDTQEIIGWLAWSVDGYLKKEAVIKYGWEF